MSRASLHRSTRVVVFADWDASQRMAGESDSPSFPEGVQYIRVPGNGQQLQEVRSEVEQDLDDPKTLTEAIKRTFALYPSQRKGIVLWDHGAGWKVGFGGDSQNGTREKIQPMSVQTLSQAVKDGLAGTKADFLGIDACLMGGAEVAYAFKDVAHVYIGAAELDYGPGWDYEKTLTALDQSPGDTPQAFAQKEVAAWDAHHKQASADDILLRSQIAIDLSRLGDFVNAAKSLSAALESSTSTVPMARAQFHSLPAYKDDLEVDSSTLTLRDVGQFLTNLRSQIEFKNTPVDTSAQKMFEALKAMTIGISQGTLRQKANQTGFHIELTPAIELNGDYLTKYQTLVNFSEPGGWLSVLKKYHVSKDTSGPIITDVALENGTSGKPKLVFATQDADAAEASISIACESEQANQYQFHGLVASGQLLPSVQNQFEWDRSAEGLGDAPVMVLRWSVMGADAQGEVAPSILGIPAVFQHDDLGEVFGMLLFQDGETLVSTAVIETKGGQPSTLSLKDLVKYFPGLTFNPIIATAAVNPDTQQIGEGEIQQGAITAIPEVGQLNLQRVSLAGRNCLMQLTSTDVWGNSAKSYHLIPKEGGL